MSRPRSTTEEERIEGLAECLADALDVAGLYDLKTERDWRQAIRIFQKMLTGLVVHRWCPDAEKASIHVYGVEPWIMEAMERAMIARGPSESDVWVQRTTVN